LWQVLDSNQRRLQPTILQTAPFGRSGNLPCRVDLHPAAGRNNTQLQSIRANHLQSRSARFGTIAPSHIPENGAAKVAGESSFDVVSKVDRQEVDNALNQAAKEVRQRFDFKNTDASIRWSGPAVEMEANSEERVKAVLDVFQSKLVRRGVSLKALDAGDPRSSGKLYKITATTKEGISQENAKKVSKLIRDDGPKSVRAQVQGDELRVSSKSRDDLQKVQALIKAADLDFAVQFTNYR
jgi:cyclic-di-GMP-binding protein